MTAASLQLSSLQHPSPTPPLIPGSCATSPSEAPSWLQLAISSSLLGSGGVLEPGLTESRKLVVTFSGFCKLVDITLIV